MFDFGYEPWGETPPFRAPVFVLTHRPQERIDKQGGTSYTFVTDGIAAAVEQAKAAAGGKDVLLAGGLSLAQQALAAGLVDELAVHVRSVLAMSVIAVAWRHRPGQRMAGVWGSVAAAGGAAAPKTAAPHPSSMMTRQSSVRTDVRVSGWRHGHSLGRGRTIVAALSPLGVTLAVPKGILSGTPVIGSDTDR